jgi:heterodisulfide reductase subunit B
MVAMADRNLQIARFIGTTPSLAYCDVCRLAFRTKQEFLQDSEKAKQQLQSEFEKHECKPDPQAVNDALTQIK